MRLGRAVVVVAQLAEWSLPIPEVRCSNPVIGKVLYEYKLLKSNNKEKRSREWPNLFKIRTRILGGEH